MLDHGSGGVCSKTAYDHGEHVYACHDGVHVQLDLEVECDPEVEDGEAEEAEGDDDEELFVMLVGGDSYEHPVLLGTAYQRKVLVEPDFHVDHSVLVLYFPYDECCNYKDTEDQENQDVGCFPTLGRVASETTSHVSFQLHQVLFPGSYLRAAQNMPMPIIASIVPGKSSFFSACLFNVCLGMVSFGTVKAATILISKYVIASK